MSHRDMKEELTCPICMELFQQPRRLPCGHSYCYICLKAMLDRCTENSGLCLNYSRSLVCPECREEISIDYGRGIEVIPPDFKLSKLVDLFKFMKTNDSSDSSGDELQLCKSVRHPVTNNPPRSGELKAAAASATLSVNSLPTTVVSLHTDSPSQASHPLTVTLITSHSTQPQQSSLFVPGASTGTSGALANSQEQPNSTHSISESSGAPTVSEQVSSSSTSHPSDAECSINQSAAVNIRSTNVADSLDSHNTSEISVINNTSHTNTGTNVSTFSPSDIISNAVASIPVQTNGQSQTSSAENQLGTDSGGSTNAKIVSGGDADVHVSRSAGQENNYEEELNSYSDLRAVGGVAANGRNTDGLSSRSEQHVDPLEILSDWVNENHYYSQSCHNLSHSSVSLPTDAVREEAQNFQENSAELNSQFHNADRVTRAQSVPTETGEWKRPVESGGTTEHVASKSHHNVKAKKVKRGVFSRFVDSDSSSDSGESDRGVGQKSAEKPKRWLMARFLRSVILSDSSSTDYSDDDEEALKNNARISERHTETTHAQHRHSSTVSSSRLQSLTTGHSQQSHPQTGTSVTISARKTHCFRSSVNEPDAGKSSNPEVTMERSSSDHISDQSQTASARKNISSSGRRRDVDGEMSGAVLRSIDSNTLPKQLVRHSSIDSTTPKVTNNCESSTKGQNFALISSSVASFNSGCPRSLPATRRTYIPQLESNSYSEGRQGGYTVRNQIEQATSNLPSIESPLTSYDNLHSSGGDNGERTWYDNIGNANSLHVGVDAPLPDTVRGSGFNSCNQQQSTSFMSGSSQGITLYDNVDNSEIRPGQASPRSHHRNIHTRNPMTEIEDLKTGYEDIQVHMENRDIGATVNEDNDSGTRNKEKRDRHDLIKHTRELEHKTSSLILSSQEPQHRSDQNVRPDPESSKHHHPTSHAVVDSGDYPSMFDNVSRSVSLGHSQDSVPALSNRVNASNRSEVFEGNSTSMAEILAYRDRNLHFDSVAGGCHNNHYLLDIQARSDDDLQYVDNYFDQYSEHFRRGVVPTQSFAHPGVAPREHVSQRRTGGAGDTGTVAAGGSSQVTRDAEVEACSTTNNGKVAGNAGRDVDGSEDVDDDDGSHSGTSMLQNKKKPRSRLKKFLTSLLSLSSSSDDDDENYHRNSSSESSDW